MMKTEPDFKRLPVGAALKHATYGRGRVTRILEDGRQVVVFGEQGQERVFGGPGSPSGRASRGEDMLGDGEWAVCMST